MSTMTPYKAATLVNAELDKYGIKRIPPQMMYNYAKKNYIATEIVEGAKRITSEGLQSWLKGYIAKKTNSSIVETENNIDENQMVLFS